MKKYVLFFVLLGIMPAFAAESGAGRYSGSYEATRAVRTNTYKTSGGTKSKYNNTITNNFYYNGGGQPYGYQRSRSSNLYYTGNREERANDYRQYAARPVAERKSSASSYSSQTRKYFLAHPFFQPTEGRFGSVTDLSYGMNKFKFDFLNASVQDIDSASATHGQVITGVVNLNGTSETTQFAVKEDFSYGITDTLSVLGMVQYDSTKITLKDWSSGDDSNSISDSGINVYGLGLQYRFVDNDDWIAMMNASFQHQKDTANSLIFGIKAGRKIDKTTVYGLARLGYSDLTKGDTYGSYVSDKSGDWLMLAYKTNVDSVVYVEGGLGAFTVLNSELVYGSYDWHNQLSVKGAIGFQPEDSFALNLYASASLYDSAKGKVLKYMNYDKDPTKYPEDTNGTQYLTGSHLLYTTGDYKIKDYNEWKVGIQAIFYF